MGEPTVYVVDNGGQWTHREWRTLKYLDAETEIVPNTVTLEELEEAGCDGVVLSGGSPRVGLDDGLGNCGAIVDGFDGPVLGICAGHQFMAMHFGGRCAPGDVPEFGAQDVEVVDADDLFVGLPDRFRAWTSHNDEVVEIPDGFRVLARSETCPVQAMGHEERPLFGLQFHPEVEHTQHGAQIFDNFLTVCEGH